jgi:hypothetical protein
MTKLGVNSAWLEGLNGEERDKMREYVLANKNLLDKLKEILYNMNRRTEEVVLSSYDNPNWSHKQAHFNGQADIVRKLISICTISEREDQSQQ